MTADGERVTSYEVLARELLRKGFPPEGFVLPGRRVDLLQHPNEDLHPYERWLKGRAGQTPFPPGREG